MGLTRKELGILAALGTIVIALFCIGGLLVLSPSVLTPTTSGQQQVIRYAPIATVTSAPPTIPATATIAEPTSTPTCDARVYLTKVQIIRDDFSKAQEGLSRVFLSPKQPALELILQDMVTIKADYNRLQPPPCAQPLHQALGEMMDTTISAVMITYIEGLSSSATKKFDEANDKAVKFSSEMRQLQLDQVR